MIPDAVKMFILSTFCAEQLPHSGQAPMHESTEYQPLPIRPERHFLPMMPRLPLLRVLWRTHEHSRILIRETCLAVAVFQS
jgi:hypothetical protein